MLDQMAVEKIKIALRSGKSEVDIINALKTVGYSDSDILDMIVEARKQEATVISTTPQVQPQVQAEPQQSRTEKDGKFVISNTMLFTVIAVLLVIDAAVYVGTHYFAKPRISCDENDLMCIMSAIMKNCTPTTAILGESGSEMEFEVLGPQNGYCVVSNTFTKINGTISSLYSGAVVGDYYICRAPLGDTEVGFTDPNAFCKGPLYDLVCRTGTCAAAKDTT